MAKPTQRELDLGYCEEAQTYCSVAEERYKQGRADKYQEIVSGYRLLTEEQVAEIRADAIDEVLEIIRNCFGYSTSEMIRRVEALKEQNK